tara:strand:+ start:21 stop:560 length:540 start_codon:yes stop_codon:yes gene_type:complete
MGIPTLIATLTASSSATLADTSSMTSAYDEYMFVFTDLHPETDEVDFGFQVNADGESGYNETITSTFFHSTHDEADSATELAYDTGMDQAQGTAYSWMSYNTGNDADQAAAGILHIFNPSNTTYVKHFYSRFQNVHAGDYSVDTFAAGYINTTSAITDISFKFESGNIDAGVIQIYGIA